MILFVFLMISWRLFIIILLLFFFFLYIYFFFKATDKNLWQVYIRVKSPQAGSQWSIPLIWIPMFAMCNPVQ